MQLWGKLLLGKKKSKLVPAFSSYLMAGSHGLFISLYALWILTADDWHNFNSPNTESQNIALALSLGYFIAVRHVDHNPQRTNKILSNFNI
jgi:hypothetical protein